MAEVRIKDIDEQEIDTILAEDIDFEGHLTFKKPLMIKGKFKGEIKSTSSLYIGEKALVEATTEAAVVSSKGNHKGNIVGHSRVELFSTAQVDGDITTPDFVVESGCKFNGYCNMGGVPRKDAPHQGHQQQPQAAQQAAAPQPVPHAPSQPSPGAQQGGQQGAQQQRQQGGPSQNPQNHHQGQHQNPQNQQQGQQQNPQQRPGSPSQGSGGQQR